MGSSLDLPLPLLVAIIESLEFRDVVRLLDLVLSNKGNPDSNKYIRANLRCPDLNNRMYSEAALRWVLDKEITINKFTVDGELTSGEILLHKACFDGKVWLAQACITFNNADVNALNDYKNTPLHHACHFGHTDIIKILLNAGGKPSLNYKNNGDKTPLELAAVQGCCQTMTLLISCEEKGIQVISRENVENVFCILARLQSLKNLKIILGLCGADIIHCRTKKFSGATPLIRAMEGSGCCNNVDVLNLLLEFGSEIDAIDDDGDTALTCCAFNGHAKCAKILIDRGAKINHVVKSSGRTPLDLALFPVNNLTEAQQEGKNEMVKLLRLCGGLTFSDLPVVQMNNEAIMQG